MQKDRETTTFCSARAFEATSACTDQLGYGGVCLTASLEKARTNTASLPLPIPANQVVVLKIKNTSAASDTLRGYRLDYNTQHLIAK